MFHLSFENPLYMLCLFLIPVLIFLHFYLLKHSEDKALRFANFEAIKDVTGRKHITKNIWLLVIRVLVLICIILGASGMTIWHESEINQDDFVIAMDISPSMSTRDIDPSRIDVAKQISGWIINNSEYGKIGIVSFSGLTFVESNPITNKNSLRKTINNIDVKKIGGTDMSGAIITSTNLLMNSEKSKKIILISDGTDTAKAFVDKGVENSIDYANLNHVVIHTIGLGTKEGALDYVPEGVNVSGSYNEDMMKEISNSTGGEFFDVKSLEEFKDPYLETVKDTKKGMVPFRVGEKAIILALVLLFLEWMLVNTRFRKIP